MRNVVSWAINLFVLDLPLYGAVHTIRLHLGVTLLQELLFYYFAILLREECQSPCQCSISILVTVRLQNKTLGFCVGRQKIHNTGSKLISTQAAFCLVPDVAHDVFGDAIEDGEIVHAEFGPVVQS